MHTIPTPPQALLASGSAPILLEAKWLAWYDGSALPNPGKIGLGAIVQSPSGQRFERTKLARQEGCNNEAELYALCEALDLAYAAGARKLLVTGDSDFVVQHLRGKASTKIERLLVLLQKAATMMADFENIELVWVPRHRNEAANLLARSALGLAA